MKSLPWVCFCVLGRKMQFEWSWNGIFLVMISWPWVWISLRRAWKSANVVIKLVHFCAFHGSRDELCELCPCFSRILLPKHEKFYTCGGLGPLASPSHPEHQVLLASTRTFHQSHTHSSGQWLAGLALLWVYSEHRGLLTARHTCGNQ